MLPFLTNPVFDALTSGDRGLSLGTVKVRFFDEEVSPFAGFDDSHERGFDELYELLPPRRKLLYATPRIIAQPKGWNLVHAVKGIQMVQQKTDVTFTGPQPVRLTQENIDQMVGLAQLTRPGPFGRRTIDFGHYFGFFEGETLVAMTGQRLHPGGFTEVSAVCTHPDHTGKGYGSALVAHQVRLIRSQGQIPFLHVREDNHQAIRVYERLGFSLAGPMNFYFMKRS